MSTATPPGSAGRGIPSSSSPSTASSAVKCTPGDEPPVRLAFLGFLYHCNQASLVKEKKKKSIFGGGRLRALLHKGFRFGNQHHRRKPGSSLDVSDLKFHFFSSEERAKRHADCEWRLRRAITRQRNRLVKIANGMSDVEEKFFGAAKAKPSQTVPNLFDKSSTTDPDKFGVSPLPLSVAFRLLQEYPCYYEVACDPKEKSAARKVIKRQRGNNASRKFEGVPLFTIPGVRLVLSTPTESFARTKGALTGSDDAGGGSATSSSMVSYVPVFLSKAHLDRAWAVARSVLSQSFRAKRKWERERILSRVIKAAVKTCGLHYSNNGGGGGAYRPGDDMGDENGDYPGAWDGMDNDNAVDENDENDEDTAGLADPPEIKEFLEELGEGSRSPNNVVNRRGNPLFPSKGSDAWGGKHPKPIALVFFIARALSLVASSMACSATALGGQAVCALADSVDWLLLEHPAGWRVLGLNPDANVQVSSLGEVMAEIDSRDKRGNKVCDASEGDHGGDPALDASEDTSVQSDASAADEQSGRLSNLQAKFPFQMSSVSDVASEGKELEHDMPALSFGVANGGAGGKQGINGTIEFDWDMAQRQPKQQKPAAKDAAGLLFIGGIGFSDVVLWHKQ